MEAKKRRNEIEGLDSLRGILCVWVILYHTSGRTNLNFLESFPPPLNSFRLFKYGPLGVDGFFSLSGFIITHVYQDKFLKYYEGEEHSCKKFLYIFWNFMINRIARLYPLVVLAETMGILLTGSFRRCYYDYFLISPYINRFGADSPIWSLGVEFQLYICFPLYIYIINKLNKSKNSIIYIVLSLFGTIWMSLLVIYIPWFPFSFPRGHGGFLTGICCYLLYQNYPKKSWIFDVIMLFISIIFITLMLFIPEINEEFCFYQVYFFYYLMLILPFFIAKSNSFAFKFLNLEILRILGEISFTLYLLHQPLLDHLNDYMILTYGDKFVTNQLIISCYYLGLITTLSLLVYRYFETPCRDEIKKIWIKIEKWHENRFIKKESMPLTKGVDV